MRQEIKLTDEQIEAAFSELGHGLTVDDLVFTKDTLDDFEQGIRGMHSHGSIVRDSESLEAERVQVRKGDARRTVVVIDFGEARAVVSHSDWRDDFCGHYGW